MTVATDMTTSENAGRNPAEAPTRAEQIEWEGPGTKAEPTLMESVVSRPNMQRAYNRVLRNKGAAGVDGLSVSELGDLLRQHWPTIKAKLLEGRYQPQPVRQVSIPKPQGGERQLGIPTVLDRLIQQALHQCLSPLFEAGFSEASFGFRPGRSAQQAVQRAQSHVQEGYDWVVDLDLEKFFDRVNHDLLMDRVRRQVNDPRVLKLIRKYLKVGLMAGGLHSPRREGTPQGGPLSPLLSNILLTDLDRELESRGHRFVRYADDVVIYVKSERAGERVLANVRTFVESKLRLKVNAKKSAVSRPSSRPFLGYAITTRGDLRISLESRKRFIGKLRQMLRKARGRALRSTIDDINPVLRGWAAYFKLAASKTALTVIDGWVRRKLRCIVWRQWKRPGTRERWLRRLGLNVERAWKSSVNGRGPWWNAGASHMNMAFPKARFDRLGLVSVLDTVRRLQRVI
ncbi:MAG: group II intron reverse transcriptase/maturase [Pseudomonadota bacterium]